MAAPGWFVFPIVAGETWSRTVSYAGAGRVPVDVTGYTGQLVARDAAGNAVVTLTTGNGGVTAAGTEFTLAMAPAATAALPAGRLFYRFVVTSPGGVVIPLLEGWLDVDAG